MVVTAAGGVSCKGLIGTAPVPLEWPEQQVRVEVEDLSPLIKGVSYRMVGPTVKQLVVDIPVIPPGQECRATVTFEVKRYSLKPPEDTARFVMPNVKKLKPEMRVYLAPSPYIESNHATIRALAKELLADQHDLTAWERVETLYDGARGKVEYVNGPLKSAVQALKDGTGDCEELSSLFIALCRANDVPARIVWVPSHCYPEFYLEDDKGNGYWFPCEAAGNRIFGGITDHRPILQKGDNFQAPERPRERQRYVAEYLTGKGGKPQVKFLREILAAD
jgi:transglutaminase-like putative cysteine protease